MYGQGVTGSIHGNIGDPTHASINSASVAATNQDTGYRAQTATNNVGEYTIPNLPPGKYDVEVTANGFKPLVSKDVAVVVNSSATVNFTLQVGVQAEVVSVEAIASLVDTTSSSMGNDLTTREINSLPLNGRVYSQLVQVMPGAVKTGIGQSAESGSGVGATGSITASVNGVVYQGTNFTLDGVSNMEQQNAFSERDPADG